MTLLLDNADVLRVLDLDACITALEEAFGDLASGRATNRPRSHSYTPLGEGRHYLFKSMDGSLPRHGVHALRLSSDHTHEFTRDGRRRREKIASAPGGRYVGLVLLFDIETLVPLAIIQDGELQRARVGCTSAVAARHLARTDARRVALVGSGWQAEMQLRALARVRDLADVRVYSTDPTHAERFCARLAPEVGIPVAPARTARETVADADIVVLATNSHDPVIAGAWLEPGQHVNSVQSHEIDDATLDRAALIAVRSRDAATFHFPPGQGPVEATEVRDPPADLRRKMAELGEVIAGRAGRRSPEDITLFTGGGLGVSSGLGIQFAAAGYAVYRAARDAGVGRELPTEWFTETAKP
ncbi:MAG TPA: ornithine cyclodeaminase family protein [Candidatus Limnocylindria bacterium]|nr:ornithine cyclodeaminase family protein [Candidatus Limnocylindria bacterium]